MYLKAAGSLLVLFSTAALGHLAAERLKLRVTLLQQLKQVLLMLCGEIRCQRGTLGESFLRIARRSKEPFAGWLGQMERKMSCMDGKAFAGLWEEATKTCLCGKGFLETDLLFIRELGSRIGYLDATMQEAVLVEAMDWTEGEIQKAAAELSEKVKLCRMLGTFAGLLLIVLLL